MLLLDACVITTCKHKFIDHASFHMCKYSATNTSGEQGKDQEEIDYAFSIRKGKKRRRKIFVCPEIFEEI
jgi:hypothetical protein